MADGIGKALWQIYEDAVVNSLEQKDSGVAIAILRFIEAFEPELRENKLEFYCKTSERLNRDGKADIRSEK